jgi:type II secretory pathway predicted ATPase ExeA
MDVEKTIEFILDTQAKTETILQSLAGRMDQADVRMTKAEARMDHFDRRMRFYIKVGARHIAKIHEAQDRNDAGLEKLRLRLDEVTEKLDALITVVDGVVRRPGLPPVA